MAEKIQYVTLGVASEVLAAPVTAVQEILDMRPIARLAQAPASLLGMIDVRGQGIPVLDLRLQLGLEPAEDSENTRIVVLCVPSGDRLLTVGLRADRVFEVTVLDQEQLDPPPTVSAGWQDHCIAGIGRRNGGFVTVLDLGRLLAGLKLPQLAGAAADRAA